MWLHVHFTLSHLCIWVAEMVMFFVFQEVKIYKTEIPAFKYFLVCWSMMVYWFCIAWMAWLELDDDSTTKAHLLVFQVYTGNSIPFSFRVLCKDPSESYLFSSKCVSISLYMHHIKCILIYLYGGRFFYLRGLGNTTVPDVYISCSYLRHSFYYWCYIFVDFVYPGISL
jgi:hypothetical protein